jgi:pentatricopeptide repeat protein
VNSLLSIVFLLRDVDRAEDMFDQAIEDSYSVEEKE